MTLNVANFWKTNLTFALGVNHAVLIYLESRHFSVYSKPQNNRLPCTCKFEMDCNIKVVRWQKLHFPVEAILKQTCRLFTVLKYLFLRYLSQFVSEMFNSFQCDSTKCVPQFELNSFVTMATCWVPDLPNVKGIFGQLWHSFFIFANDAWCVLSKKPKILMC